MPKAHPHERWAKLKSAYRRGEGSIADLAPRFGIPKSTAEKRCALERWPVQRQELGSKAEARAAERDVEQLARVLSGHRTRARAVQALLDQVVQEMQSGKRKRSPWAIEKLMAALAQSVKVERVALGIEGDRPASMLEEFGLGSGVDIQVKRRRNAEVPEAAAAAVPAPAKLAAVKG